MNNRTLLTIVCSIIFSCAPALAEPPQEFSWAGGIEDTFIPDAPKGMRSLDEYELTQHYTQWREDLDKAKSLGITKLRWGVPWYKVEPKPGEYDWTWTDQVLDYMVDKLHIDPIIDLVHYGTPGWIKESFADPSYPDEVYRYTKAFTERYKDKIRYYTPVNEPMVAADFCGRKGLWPPYLKGEIGFVKVLLGIARGAQRTAKAIKETDPDAVLVAVEAMRHSRAAHGTWPEISAASVELAESMMCFELVSGMVTDKDHPFYESLLKDGAREEDLAALKENAIKYDIFGVNFYPWSSTTVELKEGKIVSTNGPDHGRQLIDVLRWCHRRSDLPLFVTETSATGTLDRRKLWMSETIDAVRLARDMGIPVVGYTWFPIITMIDWKYRTEQKPLADYLLHLGLWDASFEGTKLVRHETPMVETYKDYIKMGMPTGAK